MSRQVRSIDAYFEATGPYSLTRGEAEHVYGLGLEYVSRHTGAVALTNLRGANIPLGDKPITNKNVRLSQAPHSAILTKRSLIINGQRLSGNAHAVYSRSTSELKSSEVIVSKVGSYGTGSMALTLAHEVGHTFIGADHCADTSCLMTAEPSAETEQQLLMRPDPFCDDCAGDLELAGYQALAAQL